jgi:hypothetical protein
VNEIQLAKDLKSIVILGYAGEVMRIMVVGVTLKTWVIYVQGMNMLS